MKREDFVRNLRGADQGADLDTEMLQGIYDRIKENELKAGPDHVTQVARVEETILSNGSKKGKQQNPKQPLASDTSRRLVCFCRLVEVPDALHKKAKMKADAHQRGIFLFNDLLVVTKTLSKKDSKKPSVQYQYRFYLELRDLRINVFSTNQFPFGVQLQDKLTGKIAGTFNARSQADQQRFVNDLEESIAEMMEMEHTNKTNGTLKNSILMSKMSLLRSRLLPLLRNGSQRSYMAGPGGRLSNNRTPQGLTLESLKREWSLLTLFGVVGVSMTGVVWYCWRLAFRNECVSWSRSAEPWNAYSDKEFKIMKTGEEKHRTRQIPEEFLEAINYKK